MRSYSEVLIFFGNPPGQVGQKISDYLVLLNILFIITNYIQTKGLLFEPGQKKQAR